MQPDNLSLANKVLRGGVWIFAQRIASQVFTLVRVTVLARILSPQDIGLVGVAFVAMNMLYILAQTGVIQALVRKGDDIEDHLDTVWIISIIRGLFLSISLFLCAPFIAHFFRNEEITDIMRVLALTPLILGLNSPKTVYFQKHFQFDKQFRIEIVSIAVEMIVAIAIAIIKIDYWAIVWGYTAGCFSRLILSYVVYPYRPKFAFKMSQAKDLLSFGKWIFLGGLLNYAIMNGDNIYVGKMLGAASLGLYQVAFRFSHLFSSEVTNAANQILFPAFSRLHESRLNMQEAFSRTLEMIAMLSFPIVVAMVLLAEDFTLSVIGEKWAPMILSMRVLLIASMIRSFTETGNALFTGVGKPELYSYMNILSLFVMGICIYPLSHAYGILGVAVAVLAGVIASAARWYFEVRKITAFTHMRLIRIMYTPAGCAIAMGCTIILVQHSGLQLGTIRLVVAISLAVITYCICVVAMSQRFRHKPLESVKDVIKTMVCR